MPDTATNSAQNHNYRDIQKFSRVDLRALLDNAIEVTKQASIIADANGYSMGGCGFTPSEDEVKQGQAFINLRMRLEARANCFDQGIPVERVPAAMAPSMVAELRGVLEAIREVAFENISNPTASGLTPVLLAEQQKTLVWMDDLIRKDYLPHLKEKAGIATVEEAA